ncbi:MAG: DUF5668 domain-containing protein [Candidatus Gracilibacteria bacterium]|nr:DUF5668 domain-containing protein [Candidatus Gracilibacteria bacterium]
MGKNNKTEREDGIFVALLITGIGIIFLFKNTFGIDLNLDFSKIWPVILVLFGMYKLYFFYKNK